MSRTRFTAPDDAPSPPELPQAFLRAFRDLEVASTLEHAKLIPEVSQHHPLTGWWFVIWVCPARERRPQTWALLYRPHTDEDMHTAALELFRLVYPSVKK